MTENGAQLVAESVPKCGSAARNLVPFIFFSVDPDFAKFRKISEVPHWPSVQADLVNAMASMAWYAGSEWERELDAVLQDVDTSATPIIYVRASQYCSRL